MKKRVYKIDENGLYLEDVILQDDEELTPDLVETEIPNGLFQPKWNGESWAEGLSQGVIDVLLNVPQQKTVIDMLQEENQRLKAEAESLRQRDAKMQDDINFILEVMGG
jgi:hypothetical protein